MEDLDRCVDELEKTRIYIGIIEKENKDLKERMIEERRKAYACGWVEGRNGKPPIDICGINDVIEVHKNNISDAMVSVDGMYTTVSQLIMAFHDLKEQYDKVKDNQEE